MQKNPEDFTAKDTLLDYTRALSSMGISELIRLSPEDKHVSYQSLLADYAIKAVWYSKEGPDAHTRSAANLFFEKNLVQKEGTLGDMILLMQLSEVVYQLERFERSERPPVTIDSLKILRGSLIKNLFGNSKYGPGLRRYRNSTGPYITEPMESMVKQLKKTLALVNKKHEDPIEAFINGVQFYAEFIKIHPFEDTDGRTARLLYNWHAIRNRIRAIHISEEFKEMHTKVLHPYYFSGYIGSTFASMLLLTLTPRRIEKLKGLINIDKNDSLTVIELKSVLQASLKMISNEELCRNASKLFDGRSEKKNYAYAAIWLCNLYKLDHEIISKAHSDTEDPKLRLLAVHVMGNINYQKYKNLITESLFKDPDEKVRAQAVMQVSLNEGLRSILPKIIESEKSPLVLMALGKALTFKNSHADAIEINILQKTIKTLMESGNPDVELRGYQAFAARSTEEEITKMLDSTFLKTKPILQKEIIVELSRTNKLNNPSISERLSELAKSDVTIKQYLIGELGLNGVSGKGYERLFEHILSTKGHTDGERAHALYLLGKQKGYDYLFEIKERIGPIISKFEKLAIVLAYIDSLENSSNTSPPKHTLHELLPPGASLEIMPKVALAIQVGKLGRIDDSILKVLTEGNPNPFGMALRDEANGQPMKKIFGEIVGLCIQKPEISVPNPTPQAVPPRVASPRVRLT